MENWDNGYPSGGNYWSDYKGVDLYSGPYQNITGCDGIGDTPYIIDEYNVDRYPLMNPWTPTPQVTATVDVHPQLLNLKSMGKWITAYIELREGYDVADINVSTLLLYNTVPVDLSAPIEIGDYDNDATPDLMVKFDRTALCTFILNKGITYDNVSLTLSGRLYNNTMFGGSTTTTVSALAGDVNCDGRVDIYDVVQACVSYGSKEGEPKWNPNANFAPPWNHINIYDIVTIASHYGKTHP